MEDDEAAKLVDDLKENIGRHNRDWANIIYDYFTSNEFNTTFMLQSELNDKNECYLLEYLQRHTKLRSIQAYQLDWIYNTSYETVFGYKPQSSEKKESYGLELKQNDNNNNNNNNILDQDIIYNENILPTDLDWDNLSYYDQSKYNTFILQHFPRLHQSLKYGESGRSLLKILSIGYKYRIDLLSLIIDIYSEYRINYI